MAYKLIEGAHTEPFPAGTVSLKAGKPGDIPRNRKQVSAILQMFYTVPAIISDSLGPDCPGLLTLSLIGIVAVNWVVVNGLPDVTLLEAEILAGTVLTLMICADTVRSVVLAIKAAVPSTVMSEASIAVFVLYGAIKVFLAIMADQSDMEWWVAQILLPFPFLMGFLNMSEFRNDPIVGPFCLPALLIIDGVGFLGGGILELIDASSSVFQVAIA